MNTSILQNTASLDRPDLAPQRVRHALRFRVLQVSAVRQITPHLLRVTLTGDDLEGFVSLGFDDHVKLFFPDPLTGVLAVPTPSEDGPVWPGGVRPVMRDYTPRHFDAARRTLDIDFALHLAGPATRWAMQAAVGQKLGVGGPRGSFIVPTGFDWHLLIGDDTALPAISRRLAELPPGSRAELVLEVDGPDDRIELHSEAELEVVWVYRSTAPAQSQPLVDALRQLRKPDGVFHSWIGCESSQAKALRAYLVDECQANPKWIRASGYWRQGAAATHDSLDS